MFSSYVMIILFFVFIMSLVFILGLHAYCVINISLIFALKLIKENANKWHKVFKIGAT